MAKVGSHRDDPIDWGRPRPATARTGGRRGIKWGHSLYIMRKSGTSPGVAWKSKIGAFRPQQSLCSMVHIVLLPQQETAFAQRAYGSSGSSLTTGRLTS